MTDLEKNLLGSVDLIKTRKNSNNFLKNGFKLNLRKGLPKGSVSKSNEDLTVDHQPMISNGACKSEDPSPTNEIWFNTWPERCDKIKSGSSSPERTNMQLPNNKLTLNEALKNISLAYSPVTKKLHLVKDFSKEQESHDKDITNCDLKDYPSPELTVKKLGHRRIQDGSFSSTVSTVSTSGSLIGSDDRSECSEPEEALARKKSFFNFFKPTEASMNVWKIFGKTSSPVHTVASSSALIQLKRPSTLPAKTLEEEQKHTQEYIEILAAAKKKEAKHCAVREKQKKLQLMQEEQQAAAARHFIQNVIPKWNQMEKNKKTQDLWWQGLPSSVRGKIWKLAIGNELNITPQLYEICLNRAQNRLSSPQQSSCGCENGQESSMDVIELDISRTFPSLGIFQQGGPYSDVLHSLLAAYVCFRPDVGYVQGMSYIAAILILNMEACDAFICFANLLNQPLHLSAFTLNQTQMNVYYSAYNQVFQGNLPKLFEHFERAGLTPDLYLLDWIYTIFAKAMPLDVACRIWDLFLRDGYEFIFRTALGILHLYQATLLTMDFLHGAQFLTKLPEDMSSDQLFKSIQCVSTCVGKMRYSQIVQKCGS